MNKNLSFKEKVGYRVRESVIIFAFRAVASWFYQSLINGLFGTLFTSFNAEDSKFRSGIAGVPCRHRKGNNTPLKKVRRATAGAFENSFIVNGLNKSSHYFLGSSLRMYGAFSMVFGIYSMLMYCIRVYALGFETDFSQIIIGGIITVVSVPMLYSGRSLAECLRTSLFARSFFVSVLMIPESKFNQPQAHGSTKYNFAVIFGMLAGFLTYLVNPWYILIAVFVFVICWVIFCQPEAGILGLIIVAPFISLFKHPTFLLASGVIVTTISYLIKYFRGKRTMRFGITGAFVALFAVAMLLGSFSAVGDGVSVKSAFMYTILLLGYFLTINLVRTRKICRQALIALASSSAVVAAYGIFQYIFGNVTANWLDNEMFSYIQGRATSFFDNPNVLGAYLIMVFPMLLVLLINMRGFQKHFLLIFATLASVLCLVWTWSRGAWLGVIVSVVIFLLIYSYKTLAFLFAFGLSAPLLRYLLPSSVVGRFMSIGSMTDSSTYYRVVTWKGVLRMLKDTWFSGIGVGQAAFEQLFPMFAYAGTETVPHTHNLIMQIITETGISGFVIFAIIMILFAQNCLEFIKHSAGEDKFIVATGLSGIISVLVMGLFDHIWYNYRVFFLFWVIIALTISFISAFRTEGECVFNKMSPDSADIGFVTGE